MKTIVVTPQTPLEEALRAGKDEDVVIVRDGHVVVLVTPFDDDDAEWYQRERDAGFIASVARAPAQISAGKTLSHEELKAKLGL